MELFSVASISRLTNAMSNFCRSNFYIFFGYFGFVEMMEFSTKSSVLLVGYFQCQLLDMLLECSWRGKGQVKLQLAFVGDRKQEDFCQSSCFLKDSHCFFFGNKKTRSIVILRYIGDICSDKLSKPQPDLREEKISFFFRRDDGRLKIFSKKIQGQKM